MKFNRYVLRVPLCLRVRPRSLYARLVFLYRNIFDRVMSSLRTIGVWIKMETKMIFVFLVGSERIQKYLHLRLMQRSCCTSIEHRTLGHCEKILSVSKRAWACTHGTTIRLFSNKSTWYKKRNLSNNADGEISKLLDKFRDTNQKDGRDVKLCVFLSS